MKMRSVYGMFIKKSQSRRIRFMDIRIVTEADWENWRKYDAHILKEEFLNKVHLKRGYVICEDSQVIGVLRWNLFWDNVPFMTLIYFDEHYRNKGFGRKVMDFWENEMKKQGYEAVMTSTQVDEGAQHFYRKMGYQDCGCLVLNIPALEQPMEMFFVKAL